MKTVINHVEAYLKEHLPNMRLEKIVPFSDNPGDYYLYKVMAKSIVPSKYFPSDCIYHVWTSWNEITQSLNYGHYNLTKSEAEQILVK